MVGFLGSSYRVKTRYEDMKTLALAAFALSWVLGILYILLLIQNGKILSNISFSAPQSGVVAIQIFLSILISFYLIYKIIKYSAYVLDGEDAEVLVIGNVLAVIIINFISPVSSMIWFLSVYYYSYDPMRAWIYFGFYLTVISIILINAHLIFIKKKIEKDKEDGQEANR